LRGILLPPAMDHSLGEIKTYLLGQRSIVGLAPLALTARTAVLRFRLEVGIVIVLALNVAFGGPLFAGTRFWNVAFPLVDFVSER
jgi:hypothetical protein